MKKLSIFAVLYVLHALAYAAPVGKLLYENHCAVCHGTEGKGGVGLPLAQRALMGRVDDHYLRTTIRVGRPGRIMPAFSKLSDAQIDAIVQHLRVLSKSPAPAYSDKPVTGNTSRGAKLFKQHCSTCHGEQGQGGKGTGVTFSRPRDLPIIPPALNNTGFLASASDQMMKDILIHGLENTPMPSFAKAGLKDQDINDIVSHVRSFSGDPPHEIIERNSPTLMLESPYSFEQTLENLRAAVEGKNFRIIREQFLENGLLPVDEQNQRQVVLYFCNFGFLNDALKIDPRVGLFLPCRITLVEKNGVVQVMAINPLSLSVLFNNDELDRACHTMHDLYMELLEEATL